MKLNIVHSLTLDYFGLANKSTKSQNLRLELNKRARQSMSDPLVALMHLFFKPINTTHTHTNIINDYDDRLLSIIAK